VEHLRPTPVQQGEAAEGDALDSPAGRSLGTAVAEAVAAPADQREAKAREVNELILAMRGGPNSAVYARALLHLLHRGAFTGLRDDMGRACAAVAVATVRGLGPQWSKQLTAKELEEIDFKKVPRPKVGPSSDAVALIAAIAIFSGFAMQALYPNVFYVTGMGKRATVSPGLLVWIVVVAFIGLLVANARRKK
jgi:hypothetical protein